jgi:hypothetical protein
MATVVTEDPLADLAGAYIRGQGGLWHESLDIGVQGTYTRSFQGCTGGSQATSTASRDGSILLLNDTRAENEPCADGVRAIDRFVIVPWDQRLYLVPELMILDFCNSVNTGAEPRSQEQSSFYFVKVGTCSAPSRGRPTLPEQWAPFILPRAVIGVTSSPLEDGTTWVSFGSADGIVLGMEPVLKQLPTDPKVIAMGAPPFRDQPLEIVEVQGERCRVQFKWARDTRPPIPEGLSVELGREAIGP